MSAGHRARAWLPSAAATEVPPALRASLDAALAGDHSDVAVALRHGTVVCRLAGRRALEIDPRGIAVAMLLWNGGELSLGSVRMPDRSWMTIEPRATSDAPWGRSDRLWHTPRPCRLDGGEPLSVFAALDYASIAAIPPLAEPARLPPGAGTAVLNLVASLARDQARSGLVYAGPYPTEALFLALLESFEYETRSDDPLGTFFAGGTTWTPAPHERMFERDGVYVQLRGRVDKVVWERRTYYRPDWQTIRRHAPRRVRDDGARAARHGAARGVQDAAGGVVCGLWALGEPIEDHLRLGEDGRLRAIVAPQTVTATRRPPLAAARPVPRDAARAVIEIVAADSAPAVASYVRAAGDRITMEWSAVDRDLIGVDGDRAWMSDRLLDVTVDRMRRAPDDHARVALVVVLLEEIAHLLGDVVRMRAQAMLATRPRGEQDAALAREEDPEAASRARSVRAGVEALVRDLAGPAASARGLDDEPDVERDEQRDGRG